jgi:hypothetical protein
VHGAINTVAATGTTNMSAGISMGTGELTGPRHTAGRSQMMVLMSDGYPNSTSAAYAAATAAAAAGVTVHTVGIPGHSAAVMQQLATNGGGTYTGFNDPSDLASLIAIFQGTGGNLVGLDHIDVQLPDGSWSMDHPLDDGLGNFHVDWTIALGANTFTVNAYGDDGTSATAELTLYGTQCGVIPEPLTVLGVFGGLAGLGGYIRRRRMA